MKSIYLLQESQSHIHIDCCRVLSGTGRGQKAIIYTKNEYKQYSSSLFITDVIHIQLRMQTYHKNRSVSALIVHMLI
jgi:hypothetical protein